jgi:hypothetical protein
VDDSCVAQGKNFAAAQYAKVGANAVGSPVRIAEAHTLAISAPRQVFQQWSLSPVEDKRARNKI